MTVRPGSMPSLAPIMGDGHGEGSRPFGMRRPAGTCCGSARTTRADDRNRMSLRGTAGALPTTLTAGGGDRSRIGLVACATYDGWVTVTTKRVLLAAPRGYCAGVDRAVVTVEKAVSSTH